ncbi:MAG: ABC transporter ATP-binding protein [Leptospirales bacterium]
MTGLSVQTENLVKNYRMGTGEVSVLKGISLSIAAGELVALTGASGAGKSTLLHILGTVDRSTSGVVMIGERRMEEESENARAAFRNRSIGFIFQFHHLLPEFSAFENVLMPAWIHQESSPSLEGRATALLERIGLGKRLQHRPSELSGGEQQRVAIARALLLHPGLVLADEPTGNLDTHTSLEVFHLLRELNREEGMTLILATHNESLARFSDRTIHMEDGRILDETPEGENKTPAVE